MANTALSAILADCRQFADRLEARRFRMTAPGARRLARGVGAGASVVAALLFARNHVPGWGARVAERLWKPELAAGLIWGRIEGPDEKIGLIQFVDYVLVLACVVTAAGVYLPLCRVVGRFGSKGRLAEVCLHVLAACGALLAAWRLAPFAGWFALSVIVLTSATTAAYSGSRISRPAVARESDLAATTLVGEGIAVAWASWVTLRSVFGPGVFCLALAILAACGWRIGKGHGSAERERGLTNDALAGAVLLLLPLIGLLRAPTYKWLLAAATLVAVLRVLVSRYPRRAFPEWLGAVAAPCSIGAVLIVPLRLRDLPDCNHFLHEAQHLGWLNSASFGKFLFADASTFYGPLREYLLGGLSLAMGGLTLDHVRIAHVLLNLFGLGIFLAVGWVVVRRRITLLALWWYIAIVKSPLFFFLNYWDLLSFGWADVARTALGAAGVVTALSAVARPLEWRPLARRLVAGGVLAGFAALYSQETGIFALIAGTIALVLDGILRVERGSLGVRAKHAAKTCGAYLAGFAAIVGSFVAVYVACGRGPGLRLTLRASAVFASGAYAAQQYPVDVKSFLSSVEFYRDLGDEFGLRIDYIVPPMILAVGGVAVVANLVWRRWNSRSTLITGLFLYAAAIYRYSLSRSDRWHLVGGAVTVYLLLVALLADAIDFRLGLTGKRLRIPLASGVFGLVALVVFWKMGEADGLSARLRRIVNGDEIASTGPPYVTKDLPRAGDVKIEAGTVPLARFIRANAKPNEPVWILTGILSGGELYFLSERRNPTRFDLWFEIFTHDDVLEALAELKRDPPVLIVGHNWYDYGPEIRAYVAENYENLSPVEGTAVLRRNGRH
jgi:hypothetical protein